MTHVVDPLPRCPSTPFTTPVASGQSAISQAASDRPLDRALLSDEEWQALLWPTSSHLPPLAGQGALS